MLNLPNNVLLNNIILQSPNSKVYQKENNWFLFCIHLEFKIIYLKVLQCPSSTDDDDQFYNKTRKLLKLN